MNAAAASAKAQAHADLAAAEADAAALLADLDNSGTGNSKYKMPSRYGPGDGPRDPSDSVASPGQDLHDQIFGDGHGFSGNWTESTLPKTGIPPNSGHVDFKKKIDDARNPRGNH